LRFCEYRLSDLLADSLPINIPYTGAGYADVVDADLSKYFDTIPHSELMQCVARRIVDRDMLRLIKMWLKAPVEERDENGKPPVSGGKGSTCGPLAIGQAESRLEVRFQNSVLRREIFVLKKEFLIHQTGHVRQQARPFVVHRPHRPS
jgi:hypothetical protein